MTRKQKNLCFFALMVGSFILMATYSWPLGLIAVCASFGLMALEDIT